MSTPKFAEIHNLVAFLEKPEESNGFEGIIDFLNVSSIKYTLTVNPIVYESCIQQFWATAKAKIVNGELQIQALVDKKKVIITKMSVRRDRMLDDVEGTECLPNDHLEGGVKFLMYPRFVQVFLDKQVERITRHKEVYVTPSHTKKVFTNMKRPGKGFSGRVTPLFLTMMVQAPEDMGEDSTAPSDSHSTPIISQPSSSKPQKKKPMRKQRKDSGPTEPVTNETHKVLDLEKANTAQAKEIASLKKRVKVESYNNASLGDQEDVSKQGRKIANLDADTEEQEVAEKQVSTDDPVTTDVEVVTTANVRATTANAPTTTIDELTLAQTLIEIKAAKPKVVTSAATTTITTRPKARGVAKDKGKAIMVEPERPLKKKDQVALDEEMARNLEAQMQAELIAEERLARKKEEEVNIALIESLDNMQAMMEANFELAQRLQAEEQGEITIEER
ncbi:hypothetical protein Tco_0389121 [Tanacetum coccineum]